MSATSWTIIACGVPIGSVRVAAARADYVAERGPFRNSVAAGCGRHRSVPNHRLPEGLLIRVAGYGRFRLCRLHRIHAWQQLAHLREVAGDAVLLPGEVVDLAVGSSAAASGIGVDLGEQLLGLGLGLAGDLVGILFCEIGRASCRERVCLAV